MKVMKRLVALMLAIMLMAVVCIPAGAVTAGDKTITINNATDGHTYKAYQIFGGTLFEGILTNITWGEGVDGDALLEDLQDPDNGFTKFSTCAGAKDVANVLADKSWTNAETDAFAVIVAANVTEAYHTSTFDDVNDVYKISNIPVGYYIIKDATPSIDGGDAYSKYMVHVTSNVAITAKSAIPTVTKMVSLNETSGYVDALSANIGDTVYFKVTATMNDRVNDYAEYALRFTESIPDGLTFGAVKSITVSGTALTEAEYTTYGVNITTDPDVTTDRVVDIAKAKKAIMDKTGGNPVNLSDTVVIVYSATVNSSIGINAQKGNTCATTLEFSNNPHSASSMGSISASAKVYSYMLTIHKIDAASAGGTHVHLPGAKFHVYRSVGATKEYAIAPAGVLTGWTTEEGKATTFVSAGTEGEFSIAGLAKNTYYIDEIQAPDGYHDINEIISVSFVAEFDKNTNEVTGFNASVYGHGVADLRAANAEKGNVVVEIRNSKGAALPETGGIGTPIFYGTGFVLVVGAAALLIGRKRKGAEN